MTMMHKSGYRQASYWTNRYHPLRCISTVLDSLEYTFLGKTVYEWLPLLALELPVYCQPISRLQIIILQVMIDTGARFPFCARVSRVPLSVSLHGPLSGNERDG